MAENIELSTIALCTVDDVKRSLDALQISAQRDPVIIQYINLFSKTIEGPKFCNRELEYKVRNEYFDGTNDAWNECINRKSIIVKAPPIVRSGQITAVEATPTAGGTGYTAGDILNITTGGNNGKIIVSTVDGSGVVTAINTTIMSSGYGYTTGSGKATSGGTGSGCTVEITADTNEVLKVYADPDYTFNSDDLMTIFDDYSVDYNSGVIKSVYGEFWSGYHSVMIYYRGGLVLYDQTTGTYTKSPPDDLRYTCAMQVAHWFRTRQDQGAEYLLNPGGAGQVNLYEPTQLLPHVYNTLLTYKRFE